MITLEHKASESWLNIISLNFVVSTAISLTRSASGRNIEDKHKKTPFKTGGRNCSAKPLALVHSDLCGKTNAQTMGGATILSHLHDVSTHYTWHVFSEWEGNVFDWFLKWKALTENSSGKDLKVLCTEFSQSLKNFKSAKIHHEHTNPKTPHQNGVAERMNKTLAEIVRLVFVDAKLPPVFWAEASFTGVYPQNQSLTPH